MAPSLLLHHPVSPTALLPVDGRTGAQMKFPNPNQIRNSLLTVCLVFGISAQALAVGNYEAPCRSQNDTFLDAKKTLETCIDHLGVAEEEKYDTLRCLNELKEVNERAKLLHDCRSKAR